MSFINRQAEQEILRRALAGPALFVLYGRRRVGKSALLRHVVADSQHVYFTADLGNRSDQLADFSATLARSFGADAWAEAVLPNWEAALRMCIAKAQSEPLTLILDEFQYLAMADPALASVLQRLWDTEIRDSRLAVVLCGSYVSFMEREVLGVRNPLYGRRTGQLLLGPLSFRDAGEFFPSWTPRERMSACGILGGIPAYLERFDPDLDLSSNVERAILGLGAPLLDEPRFLMLEELREPQTYFSICRAIAHGCGRPNEIAQAAGMPAGSGMTPYLRALQAIRFIQRRVPVSERNPERSRRGQYRLSDAFLRFWFRFVLPNRSALEAGDVDLVWKRQIMPHLAQSVAMAFEDAACEHLRALNRRGELPALYDRIGPWWRGPHEVDAVAIADDGPLILGECKWTSKPVGTNVLHHLESKLAVVTADLPRAPTQVSYALFSREGFTPALRREADERGVLLYGVEDLLGA
jgi:AAA+ ATPase superfamily predicted ATPase